MSNSPDPATERARFAERLREAGLSTERFIDVLNGRKGSPDHTLYRADSHRLGGNYGVYAGTGSGEQDGYLIDIDVDDYDDDLNDAGLAAVNDLPDTFTVESPHTSGDSPGHRYYQIDGDPISIVQDVRNDPELENPGMSWGEIRVRNQYVVGPGSQLDADGCDKDWCDDCAKPDGGYYRISEDRDIATISEADFRGLLEADLSTEEEQAALDDTAASAPTDTSGGTDPSTVLQANSWIGTYLAIGGADDRSTKDFAVCQALIENGVSESDAHELLNGSTHTKVHERGQKYWRKTWQKARVKADTAADGGTSTSNTQGSDSEEPPAQGPTWDEVMSLLASTNKGTTTPACNKAADILCREHDFVTIRESGEMYHYNPDMGYYVRKGETYIRELLNQHIAGQVNPSRTRKVETIVRDRNFVDKANDFAPPEGKVNVRNGVLDLETRELEDHSPEYYFTAALGVDYDPDATGGLWVEQVERAIDDPGERKKLEEFIGYCLEQWHHDREKNMFFVGPPASGKSTIQEAIQTLFGGSPTVSNLTPQQIADTKFDAARLYEASLNTVNDINASKIEDTGTLKRIWSGERTTLQNKFKDAFEAEPKAKHLFTANWLPRIVGQDESIYRRMLIIEFMNSIDDADLDRSVKQEMRSERVRQVLLNRALDARDRLREQDEFTNDRSREETRKKWDSWRDSHKRFLYTQFEVTGDSDQTVGKGAYYQAFKEFVGRTGYAMKSKQSITKSLQWVPEVQVNEDSYGGLEWREQDAAESDTAEDSDDLDPTATQTVARIVENEGGIFFAELRTTLGTEHEIEPDVAETAIERAVEQGRVIENGSEYLPV